MHYAVFEGRGSIRIAQGERPQPKAGEVLLQVGACSLCGSDLRPWRQGWSFTPGHEIVGRVVQPDHALHGQRCLVYIPQWCGQCPSCVGGYPQLCEALPDLVGWQRHGGYAEWVCVPEQCLIPVPNDVPTHLAPLLLDTLGTAGHGVRLSQRVLPNPSRVLVLGAGPIGLGALLVLRQMNYGPLEIFDPNPTRLAFASSLGAQTIDQIDPSERYPLVIECSGKDAARQQALESVQPLGAVVQLGEADAWQIQESKPIRRKDFFYIRSFYFPLQEFEANLAILRSERAACERLVDSKVALEGLARLFGEFARGERIKPQLFLQE